MTVKINVQLEEAYEEIYKYGQGHGVKNLWDCLKLVEKNWEELDLYTRNAYHTVQKDIEELTLDGWNNE